MCDIRQTRSAEMYIGDLRHRNKKALPPVASHQVPMLTYEELTGDYPRYPDVWDLPSDLDTDAIVNISDYCNRCPYTVYPESPVPQVFSLFRSMGLRHLPVVDHDGKLQGIITRHNLTHEFLEERLHRHQQQQRRLQQFPQ